MTRGKKCYILLLVGDFEKDNKDQKSEDACEVEDIPQEDCLKQRGKPEAPGLP